MKNDIESLKKWLQNRIDYWETVCENHYEEPKTISEDCIFEEGKTMGDEAGQLAAYYQVMEFIDGQRR